MSTDLQNVSFATVLTCLALSAVSGVPVPASDVLASSLPAAAATANSTSLGGIAAWCHGKRECAFPLEHLLHRFRHPRGRAGQCFPRSAGLLINIAGGSGRGNSPLECAAKGPTSRTDTDSGCRPFRTCHDWVCRSVHQARVSGRLVLAGYLSRKPMASKRRWCLQGTVFRTLGCVPSPLNELQMSCLRLS